MNKMAILWITGIVAVTILYRALREAGVNPLLLLGVVFWTVKKQRR